MNFNELKELIQIIDNSSLTTFSYQKDGMKLKLGKKETGELVVQAVPEIETLNKMAVSVTERVASPVLEKEFEIEESALSGTWVKSPLVGVFYASPGPEKEAFVTVGKSVKKGDVICIIEAMKVMNEITADRDGMILAIKPINESLVAYGDELVCIG